MTPQEAMNWCEQFTDNLVMVDVDAKRRTLGLQAMQVCKSALEKQIPKKPTVKKSCKVNAFTLRCPNCEAVLQSDSPCCRYCGQALDWSDTE